MTQRWAEGVLCGKLGAAWLLLMLLLILLMLLPFPVLLLNLFICAACMHLLGSGFRVWG